MENPDDIVRTLLNNAMKPSRGKNRKRIAAELGQRLDRSVTKSQLDEFTRSPQADCGVRSQKSRGARFPAAWVPAFCEVTGDNGLQYRLMSEHQRVCCELGERVLNARSTQKNLVLDIASLARHQRQNKGKGKRTRKA